MYSQNVGDNILNSDPIYSYNFADQTFSIDTSETLPTELVSYEDAEVTTTLYFFNNDRYDSNFFRSIDFNIVTCITSDVTLAVSVT